MGYVNIKRFAELSGHTVSDVIIQAQSILGISKSHLAIVFKMSRQNLDNLIKNTQQKPTEETEARAMQVKKALDIVSKACPYKLGASTMTCRINGRRLFDELSENEIDLAQVKLFAQDINKRINVQQKSPLPESIIKNQEFIDTFNAAWMAIDAIERPMSYRSGIGETNETRSN